MTDGLLEMGEKTLVAVDAYVQRSEERRDYRETHGRKLSQVHVAQLADLRERLTDILDPPADMTTLKAEFQSLCERLEGLE